METKSNRWPLTRLLVFILAACVLATVGAYLLFQHWGRATPGPGYAPTSVDVVAAYPGASAEEVERQVIIPLEVTFAGIPGLKSLRSKSLVGMAHLRLEFERRVDYYQARQEVINRLSWIASLPVGVIPTLSPASAGHEILRYALRGPKDAQGKDVYTPADLRTLQDWVVEREFRRVPRVMDVLGVGGAVTRYEVHIDPDRLRRFSITLRQVQIAIAQSNVNVGGDLVRQGDAALNVRAIGLFGGGEDPVQRVRSLNDPREAAARLRAEEQRRLREIRSLVITTVNAVPVHLEDVVEGGRLAPEQELGRKGVVLGRQPGQSRAGLARRGEPDEDDPVLGVVFLRPGEDRGAAVEAVKAKVQEINDTPGRLLPGVRLEPLWYRSDATEDNLLILRAGFPANISSREIAETMRKARAILLHYPEVRAALSEVGPFESGSDPTGAEGVQVVGLLHPEKDHPRSHRELRDDVQAELSRELVGIDWDFLPDSVDDFWAAFEAPPGAGLLKIFGADLEELERLAGKAKAELQKLEGVSDIHVRHVVGKPTLEFVIDSEKCARWGVSVADVNNVLTLAVSGQRATSMIEGEKTFDVTLLWPQPQRRNSESILDIPLDVISNVPVPDKNPGAAPAPALAPLPPRLRLRDLVSPRGADGHPDPKRALVRPGIRAIWREQGRRMMGVHFLIRNRKEAEVMAEAEKTLAPLFSESYRAEWSVGVVMPRSGFVKP